MAQELSLPEGITPPPSSESIKDVTLTQDEHDLAVAQAKWIKLERLNKEKQNEYLKNLQRNYTRKWGWIELLGFVRHRAETEMKINLQVDESNEQIIEALCKYFTNDVLFEKMGDGWSLNKGLMLMGGVGTGKTTLVRLFSKNQKQCFTVLSCRTCVGKYEDDGDVAIEKLGDDVPEMGRDPRWFYQKHIGRCYDDLGTEKTPIIRYGNKTNVMADILLNRYDAGKLTHVTTNLLPKDIEEMYGTRVKSRMREMFNLLTVSGDDRRK